jgi:hypothetical protein
MIRVPSLGINRAARMDYLERCFNREKGLRNRGWNIVRERQRVEFLLK